MVGRGNDVIDLLPRPIPAKLPALLQSLPAAILLGRDWASGR